MYFRASPSGEDSAALIGMEYHDVLYKLCSASIRAWQQAHVLAYTRGKHHISIIKVLTLPTDHRRFSSPPHFKFTLGVLGGRIEPQLSRLSAFCAELSRRYQSLHARFPARVAAMAALKVFSIRAREGTNRDGWQSGPTTVKKR